MSLAIAMIMTGVLSLREMLFVPPYSDRLIPVTLAVTGLTLCSATLYWRARKRGLPI
jgi:hypothetical protein